MWQKTAFDLDRHKESAMFHLRNKVEEKTADVQGSAGRINGL